VHANTHDDDNLKLIINEGGAAVPIINPNGAKTWAAGSIISFTYDPNNGSPQWVMNST